MRETNAQKGITLVALIITIVVLLIISTITIRNITSTEIIDKAEGATNEYAIAQEKTELQEQVLKWQMTHTSKGKTLLNYLEEKYDIDNVQLNTDKSITVKVQSGNRYQVTEDAEATFLDGTVQEPIPIGIQIGDKVEYNEGTGKTSTIDSAFKMNDLEWRVLDIEEDGTIELISTQTTSSGFLLSGEEGWLNAEENLDTLCDELYGKGNGALKARSIKVEDIDKLAGITTDADRKALNSDYGSWWRYKYDETAAKIKYSKSTDYNPETGKGSWTNFSDSFYKTFNEPGKAQLNSLNTTDIAELQHNYYKYSIQEKINITTLDGISMAQIISKGLENDSTVSDSNLNYWLSSRSIICTTAYADFYIRRVYNGEMTTRFVCGSGGNSSEDNIKVRPVVVLKAGTTLAKSGGVWHIEE